MPLWLCAQWHVTESARRRWQRYKAMIDEEARNQVAYADAGIAIKEPITLEVCVKHASPTVFLFLWSFLPSWRLHA